MAALAALAGSAGVASVALFYYLLLAALLRDRGKTDDLLTSSHYDALWQEQMYEEMDLNWIMQRVNSEWRLKDANDYCKHLFDGRWNKF